MQILTNVFKMLVMKRQFAKIHKVIIYVIARMVLLVTQSAEDAGNLENVLQTQIVLIRLSAISQSV